MPFTPVAPKSTEPPPGVHYEIRDATGTLIAVHRREDKPDGSKRMWWELPDGTKGLRRVPLADLPLYGIERLDRLASRVIVTEGEKAADALTTAGILAVGTVTGASSCPGPTALGELNGLWVILWPDADEVGGPHMQNVAPGLTGIAASVSLLGWSDAPEHGDAADYLFPDKSAHELHAMALAVRGGAAPFAPTGPRTLDDLHDAFLDAAVIPEIVEPTGGGTGADAGDAEGSHRGVHGPSQATQLINLCLADKGIELFRDLDGLPYASVPVRDHVETYALEARSRAFPAWLRRRFHEATGRSAGRNAVGEAVDQLEAEALFGDSVRPVYRRVAEGDGRWYLDLGDAGRQVVELTADSWRVIERAPATFLRSPTAAPLPVPERGGSIDELRPFLQTGDDESLFRLIVGWIIAALRPSGPYPVLAIRGEHGAAKTTTAIVAKAFVDPSSGELGAIPMLSRLPRKPEDFPPAIAGRHVIAGGNVSFIPNWLSDDLATLAVGGAWPMRVLYTNLDELVVNACRPILLEGIPDVVAQPDLADRTIAVGLPVLLRKRSEAEFWAAFRQARPRIMGALLDALVAARRTVDRVHLTVDVRMVDAARFVVAAQAQLGWEPGAYEGDLAEMRVGSSELLLADSPLTAPLRVLVAGLPDGSPWYGSASDLLEALEGRSGERGTAGHRWPPDGTRLSKVLRRLTPDLRRDGIEVEFDKHIGDRHRLIVIHRHESGLPSGPSGPSGLSLSEQGSARPATGASSGLVAVGAGGSRGSLPTATTATDRYEEQLAAPLFEHEIGSPTATTASTPSLASKREEESGADIASGPVKTDGGYGLREERDGAGGTDPLSACVTPATDGVLARRCPYERHRPTWRSRSDGSGTCETCHPSTLATDGAPAAPTPGTEGGPA